MEPKETIVISLGGSLIAPSGIQTAFVREFCDFIRAEVLSGKHFVIITGGGSTARIYIDAAKEIASPSNVDLDWIGIGATRINARFLKALLADITHEEIILDPDSIPETDKPILIGGGWKPGNSSDLAAVHVAISVGAKSVVNLSNIDFVYDKDPHKFPDATPIHSINWSDFRAILPEEWDPGSNAPFDPIAAKKAEELGIEVAILNGKDLENLKKYLAGEEFIGTRITN